MNASPLYYGYNAPFIGGIGGFLSRQTDEQLIRNDLLQLLLISPGERVMRPDFGSPIRSFNFENITSSGLNNLGQSIKRTIEDNEGRVSVTSVVVSSDDDNNVVSIKVYGFFKFDQYIANPSNKSILVELNIPTGKVVNSLK